MNVIKIILKWYMNTIAISFVILIIATSLNFIFYKLTGIIFSPGAEWVPPTIAAAIISPILSTYITVKYK